MTRNTNSFVKHLAIAAIFIFPFATLAGDLRELNMPLISGVNNDRPQVRILYDDTIPDGTNAALAYVKLLAATYTKSVPDILAHKVDDARVFVKHTDQRHLDIQSAWIASLSLVEIRPLARDGEVITIDVITFGDNNSENGRHAPIAVTHIDGKWLVSKMLKN